METDLHLFTPISFELAPCEQARVWAAELPIPAKLWIFISFNATVDIPFVKVTTTE